jgi:hypothetical protein
VEALVQNYRYKDIKAVEFCLCVKNLARLDWVVWVAENESGRDIGFLYAFQLHPDVLAALDFRHLDVVRPKLEKEIANIRTS